MEKLDQRSVKRSKGKLLARKRVYGSAIQKPPPDNIPEWMKEVGPDTLVDNPLSEEELFDSSDSSDDLTD